MKRMWLVVCLLFVSASVFAQTVTTTDLEVPTLTVATNYASVNTPFGKFHFTFGPTANPGDSTRPDQAFAFGWNTTHDGSHELSSEPALMWRFEDYYNPSGTASYMESHLQYVSAAGVVKRPYGLQINRGTDAMSIAETADSWSYLASDGTQYIKMSPGMLILTNATKILSYTNNVAFNSQMNAAGTGSIYLPFIDNTNHTYIDLSAQGTRFGAGVDVKALSVNGVAGVTVSGASCTITAITAGVITGAHCP